MLWILITIFTPSHLKVSQRAFVMEEKALTHMNRAAQSLCDWFQQEIPPESLRQLSLSLTAPEVVREVGRRRYGGVGVRFKLHNVGKSKRRHPPWHLCSNRGNKRSTKSAKAGITSIMKTNWRGLRLLGSMGILRAFSMCACVCVFVCVCAYKFLFLPAHKINGHYHESSSHRDWVTSPGIQHDM